MLRQTNSKKEKVCASYSMILLQTANGLWSIQSLLDMQRRVAKKTVFICAMHEIIILHLKIKSKHKPPKQQQQPPNRPPKTQNKKNPHLLRLAGNEKC